MIINVERAIFNPESVFKKPHDVIVCQELTRQQKIKILRHWEADARELEVAEEENMTAPGFTSGQALGEILRALHELNAPVDTEHRPPNKQGGEPAEND